MLSAFSIQLLSFPFRLDSLNSPSLRHKCLLDQNALQGNVRQSHHYTLTNANHTYPSAILPPDSGRQLDDLLMGL